MTFGGIFFRDLVLITLSLRSIKPRTILTKNICGKVYFSLKFQTSEHSNQNLKKVNEQS